ncbi:MAG: hypothetical protein Q4P65_02045, partial [Eubacteriales bacterium]|nr:hypothetical protein [Eubacteriales bacterium]
AQIDPDNVDEHYLKERTMHEQVIKNKKCRAKTYRLNKPWSTDDLFEYVDWLNNDYSDAEGEPAVRDSYDSVEVLFLTKHQDGRYSMISKEGRLKGHFTNEEAMSLGKEIARERIRLPGKLSRPGCVDNTISYLERKTIAEFPQIENFPWLKGELFLVLDEKGKTEIDLSKENYYDKVNLSYDYLYGLIYEKGCEDG